MKTIVKTEDQLTPGVVVVRNIPHGFYENEMKKFFSQFGRVKRLRVSRSRKTGKSRGYAYIEFECEEVAKIVADTMNQYLMFNHVLKCRFLEKVPPKLFRTSKRNKFTRINTVAIHKSTHNKDRSDLREKKLMKKRLQDVRKAEKKLAEMGIDFKCEIVNSEALKRKCEDSDDKSKFSSKSDEKVGKISKKNESSANVIRIKPFKKVRQGFRPIRLSSMLKYRVLQAALLIRITCI